MRESRIEAKGCEELERAGFPTVKLGRVGWPDRQVFVAPGLHVFIEWKQPKGKLTAAQERRIPKLRERGETVFVLDDWRRAVPCVRAWANVFELRRKRL